MDDKYRDPREAEAMERMMADTREAEITRLRAEVEALRADAERYVYLACDAERSWAAWLFHEDNTQDIDDAIDAARAAQGGRG